MADTEDLVDALAVNLPQLNWAAKIRGQRTPSILPVPRGMMKQNLSLDPTSSDDIQAWAARNIPQFPIQPGNYGKQLIQEIQRQLVPQAGQPEDQTIYKTLQGLMAVGATGPGGSPGTMAAVRGRGKLPPLDIPPEAPRKIPEISMNPVESSMVSHVGYDKATGTLAVQYKDGGATYHYDNVSRQAWVALQKAKSIGGFINKNMILAARNPYEKLPPKDE